MYKVSVVVFVVAWLSMGRRGVVDATKSGCDSISSTQASSSRRINEYQTPIARHFSPITLAMGWIPFWSSSSDSDSDATKNLDPSLREFLDREQPKHPEAKPQKPETPWLSRTSAAPKPAESNESDESKPVVPPQSLFQDGRYAHIWKNYTPLHVIESSQMTEQDKMRDLVEERDTRKAELGRIALESCVFEHLAQEDCWRRGNVKDMMTMCSAEKKEFNRCYKMQAKFMKALGFMSAVGDMEREERIQMHADKLYRQMLAQEKAIEEAKARGEAEPVFENPLSEQRLGGAKLMAPPLIKPVDESVPYSRIPEHLRKEFFEQIQGMTPQEAAVEEAAFLADIENQRRTAMKGYQYLNEEAIARQKRFDKGQATIGDRAKRWWGGTAGMAPLEEETAGRLTSDSKDT
jgi:hypothetical protein